MQIPNRKLQVAFSSVLLGLGWAARANVVDPATANAGTSTATAPLLDADKVVIQRGKLVNDTRRTVVLEKAEQRAATDKWIAPVTSAFSFLTIALTAWALYRQIIEQRLNLTKQQIAEIQLQKQKACDEIRAKAMDIVMSSITPDQMEYRKQALLKFFPDELAGFGEAFDPTTSKTGHTIERSYKLLTLLAENPSERKAILKDWSLVFPSFANTSIKALLESNDIPIPPKPPMPQPG